jgi:hypothetical protein
MLQSRKYNQVMIVRLVVVVIIIVSALHGVG